MTSIIPNQFSSWMKKIPLVPLVLNHKMIGRTVDFIICGTQKGGTTALDAYLREHPAICMADLQGDPNNPKPGAKEVHFFDQEKFFCGKKPDYYSYHRRFSPEKSHKLIGEATPICA